MACWAWSEARPGAPRDTTRRRGRGSPCRSCPSAWPWVRPFRLRWQPCGLDGPRARPLLQLPLPCQRPRRDRGDARLRLCPHRAPRLSANARRGSDAQCGPRPASPRLRRACAARASWPLPGSLAHAPNETQPVEVGDRSFRPLVMLLSTGLVSMAMEVSGSGSSPPTSDLRLRLRRHPGHLPRTTFLGLSPTGSCPPREGPGRSSRSASSSGSRGFGGPAPLLSADPRLPWGTGPQGVPSGSRWALRSSARPWGF